MGADAQALGGVFGQALLLAIAVTRTASAFAVLPIMTPDLVPPMVRNSLFVSFSLIVIAMQPDALNLHLTAPQWTGLFLREAAIGLMIGFLFGTILWSFQAAGQIIDAKAGTTIAEVVDPLSGQTTSLNGAFLGRLGNFVFMFSGGLLLLVTVLLQSYAIWPLSPSAPHFTLRGVGLFETEFSRLMGLALVFSAPALVLLTLVEAGMGLMNRFAPQLNVFAMSLSIKAWLATLILLATSGLLIQALLDDIAARPGAIMAVLRALAKQ